MHKASQQRGKQNIKVHLNTNILGLFSSHKLKKQHKHFSLAFFLINSQGRADIDIHGRILTAGKNIKRSKL